MISIQFIAILLEVSLIGLCIAGSMICQKRAFREGATFFRLMLIWKGVQIAIPLFVDNWLYDNVSRDSAITIGQWIVIISWLQKLIIIAAFYILIKGIYKRLSQSPASDNS